MAKKDEKKVLKKGVAGFNLIGVAKVTDESFALNVDSESSDWRYNRMTLGVNCGEDGLIFAEMMGGFGKDRDNAMYVNGTKENENGKTVDDYENRFQIDWDDRFDESILSTVGRNCFLTVGLEKTNEGKTFYKKFLSPYDAIAYTSEHLKDGMVVNVKGRLEYQEYEGRVSVKKVIESLALSSAEENKYRATFQQTLLLDKDSVGKYDKETKTIPITAYIVEYIRKIGDKAVKKNMCLTKVFDHKADNREATERIINKNYIPKKSSQIHEIVVEGRISKKGAVQEMTVEDLPSDIRDLIEANLLTEEEAVAKCVVNNKKSEYMIITNPRIIRSEEEGVLPKMAVNDSKYVVSDLIFYEAEKQTVAANVDENSEAEVDPDSISTDEDLEKIMEELSL